MEVALFLLKELTPLSAQSRLYRSSMALKGVPVGDGFLHSFLLGYHFGCGSSYAFSCVPVAHLGRPWH
jgi:hypothetical protein